MRGMKTQEEIIQMINGMRDAGMGRVARWPQEIRRDIVKMFEGGIGLREIAERTDVVNFLSGVHFIKSRDARNFWLWSFNDGYLALREGRRHSGQCFFG